MGGSSAEKIDICFYHHCPVNRSSKKRGWLRAFLIVASAHGRRFGSAGALGWAAPGPRVKPDPKLQQCGIFYSGAASGAAARRREAPARFI